MKQKERQQNKKMGVRFVTSEPAWNMQLFIFITQGGVSLLLGYTVLRYTCRSDVCSA